MERNLRKIAQDEYELDQCLIFADRAPRDEHLQRLAAADLFLDTPAYNAHTVGCDCLSAGIPMVSLLQTANHINPNVLRKPFVTDKLASRVGASLLTAVGLEEMIANSIEEYQSIMIRCATDSKWFLNLKRRLLANRATSTLFDTRRWVKNLEVGLTEAVYTYRNNKCKSDIHVLEEP